MKLGMKRENKIEYLFHCLSKQIIQLCIDNDIGNIVIGRNKGWKQNVDLDYGSKHKDDTQNFVIPYSKLRKFIKKMENKPVRLINKEDLALAVKDIAKLNDR